MVQSLVMIPKEMHVPLTSMKEVMGLSIYVSAIEILSIRAIDFC